MLSSNPITQPECHAERNEVESKHLGWEVSAIAIFLAKLGMTPGQGYQNDQILSRDPRTQPVCHAERNEVESKHLRRAPSAIARFLALLGMKGGWFYDERIFR